MAKRPQPPATARPASDPKVSDGEKQIPGDQPGMSLEFTEFSWHAPLPPPQILKQINDVIPNGAERWMAQFEAETRHRHLLERRRQTYPFIFQLAVRATAIIFALGCLGVAVHAINQNQPLVAVAFGAATIAIGVGALLRQTAVANQSTTAKKPPAAKR